LIEWPAERHETIEAMFEMISRWLVQQPAHLLLVAVANLALWAACRATVLHALPKSNRAREFPC
jgi:hypothetical protein